MNRRLPNSSSNSASVPAEITSHPASTRAEFLESASFPGSAWERAASQAPPALTDDPSAGDAMRAGDAILGEAFSAFRGSTRDGREGRAFEAVRSQAEPGNEELRSPTTIVGT